MTTSSWKFRIVAVIHSLVASETHSQGDRTTYLTLVMYDDRLTLHPGDRVVIAQTKSARVERTEVDPVNHETIIELESVSAGVQDAYDLVDTMKANGWKPSRTLKEARAK